MGGVEKPSSWRKRMPRKIDATGNSWGSTPRSAPAPTAVPPTPPPQQNMFQKAKSYAEAVASKGFTGKRACEKIFLARYASCHGNEQEGISPCPHRAVSEKDASRYYCTACGCGDREATWLNSNNPDDYTKLHFPKVQCPLKMPGFTNYEKGDEPRKHTVEAYCQRVGLTIEGECKNCGCDK